MKAKYIRTWSHGFYLQEFPLILNGNGGCLPVLRIRPYWAVLKCYGWLWSDSMEKHHYAKKATLKQKIKLNSAFTQTDSETMKSACVVPSINISLQRKNHH